MENNNEKKFMAKKIGSTGEYKEEITYQQVSEMLLSGGFMTMLKRMQIGEKLFYNEKNIEFERTK